MKLKITFRLNIKQAVAYFGYQSTNRGLELMSNVGILYYGGWLVLHHEVTAGHLVSFILYAQELGGALEDIGSVFTGLMQAVGAADKVFGLIDRQPKINHTEGSLKPDVFSGQIELKDVSFAFPARPSSLVLKGVSFRAGPGDVIALVGPSGGGKTSCISLLERFYDPLGGSVLIDSRPLSVYDHQFLHTKMSMVGQEPVLYACTVEENIAYGMDNVDSERVQEAAKLANAHNFISAMQAGYKTQAGEKGIQLSGGQKQRVAIARAVIRDPSILLLDEATSALDAESEHLVQDALYRKMRNKTVVIVAHRLSTVENATNIIVIDKGVVVEQGDHQKLLRLGGLYAKLVQRQLMSKTGKATGGDDQTLGDCQLLETGGVSDESDMDPDSGESLSSGSMHL
jgi:ATP-binding cassette subfamily B (MDR/TAP) protein 9